MNDETYTLRDVVASACHPLDWTIGQTMAILIVTVSLVAYIPFIKMAIVSLYKDVW